MSYPFAEGLMKLFGIKRHEDAFIRPGEAGGRLVGVRIVRAVEWFAATSNVGLRAARLRGDRRYTPGFRAYGFDTVRGFALGHPYHRDRGVHVFGSASVGRWAFSWHFAGLGKSRPILPVGFERGFFL